LALFLLISGDWLPIGLGLIGLGATVRLVGARVAALLGLVGLLFAVLSAVPLPGTAYAALVLTVAAWLTCIRRSAKARQLSTATLLAVLVLVSWVALRAYPSRPPLANSGLVVVLGDSLSAGLGPDQETWPGLLASRTGRPVVNLARSGARLSDGLLQARALPSGPCLILIELGGNDLLGGATVEAFSDGLRGLVSQVAGEGRTLVMFELPLLPLQNRYGRVQRDVSREFGVRLIPRRVLAGAVALPGHTTDGLHLSMTGHRWLAETVASWL
jgi:lysophospholipase L1-like esterase